MLKRTCVCAVLLEPTISISKFPRVRARYVRTANILISMRKSADRSCICYKYSFLFDADEIAFFNIRRHQLKLDFLRLQYGSKSRRWKVRTISNGIFDTVHSYVCRIMSIFAYKMKRIFKV